jgi:hypothetical protein
MATATKRAGECGRRWAEASALAVREALEDPRAPEQHEWALSFAAGNLPKVIRRPGLGVAINFSGALANKLGLKVGGRALVLPLPEGGGLIRGASEEEVSAARALYAAGPPPCFPAKPAPEDLPEVEKLCPDCRLTFRTRQQRRIYCDGCRHERNKASHRESWRQGGKARPSYRRRLKATGLAGGSHARPAESLSQPFGDEAAGGAGSATPAGLLPPSHAAPLAPQSVPSSLKSVR